jgi:DNA-binding NarL/FixJ family response regulator
LYDSDAPGDDGAASESQWPPHQLACSVDIWSPHLLEAAGLAGILADGGCRVSVIASSVEAGFLSLVMRRPDVVLVDACLCADECNTVRQLNEEGYAVVVFIGDDRDGSFVQSVLAAGARGCLSCEEEPGMFADCVKMAAKGAVVISSDSALLMSTALSAGEQRLETEQLTETERKLALMVAQGATNKEMGEELFVSEHTVKTYLGHILHKLHLRNRQQLAAYVAEHQQLPDVRVQ